MTAGITVQPKVGRSYTVREFTEANRGIYLEEIINPVLLLDGGKRGEQGFMIERFRELLPPMEIQKELDECILVTVPK